MNLKGKTSVKYQKQEDFKNVRVSFRFFFFFFPPLNLDKPRISFEQMELMEVARKEKKIRTGNIGFRRL